MFYDTSHIDNTVHICYKLYRSQIIYDNYTEMLHSLRTQIICQFKKVCFERRLKTTDSLARTNFHRKTVPHFRSERTKRTVTVRDRSGFWNREQQS